MLPLEFNWYQKVICLCWYTVIMKSTKCYQLTNFRKCKPSSRHYFPVVPSNCDFQSAVQSLIKMMCDVFTSSMFSVSFVLSVLFFIRENCRAFRTISFPPLKLLSPYTLFGFTFLIIFQNKEYLREKIKKFKRLRHSITQSQILDQQRKPAFDCCLFWLPSPAIAIDER